MKSSFYLYAKMYKTCLKVAGFLYFTLKYKDII